ncbi:MAG: hypothetical protein ACXAE3_03140 [Candidatus Kariarchaeaceae archaeon]|jgi:hypothetical protein
MIAEDYTLETYINEIRPMVSQFHSEQEILDRFESSLNLLREEATRCDDMLKIHLSWQDGIGTELGRVYSPQELMKLHDLDEAVITRQELRVTVVGADRSVCFQYCDHQFYTPMRTEKSIHQCLRC